MKPLCFLAIFSLCAFALSAQTAAEIETLLAAPSVTYAQVARFVLKASEAAVISNPQEAFEFAAEQKWLPKNAAPDSPARLDGVSLLFMKSFNIKGGLFYSIFKTPHYAYRELIFKSVIQGRAFPQHIVSGEQLLFITSRVLSIVESGYTESE